MEFVDLLASAVGIAPKPKSPDHIKAVVLIYVSLTAGSHSLN